MMNGSLNPKAWRKQPLSYDELINNPNRLLNIICDFLSMNKTYHTDKILKSQEMMDRKLNLGKRKQKFDKIQKTLA